MSDSTQSQIEQLISEHPIVLFMKGNRMFPSCGFSATVVQILKKHKVKFEGVNVLSDPNIRQGIKDFSQWPTIPQLYVKGEFIGGCDIVQEMDANGDLEKLLSPLAS